MSRNAAGNLVAAGPLALSDAGREKGKIPNAGGAPRRFVRQQVPDSIINDPALKAAMAIFPSHYNLEIPKTVWRIRQANAKRIALQFPEGLLMFALPLCDILESFAGADECFVLGDVTYGACCVDDFSAASLGADFLVHYGHSCLVPIDNSLIPCLYVFVEIQIDVLHLVDTVKLNFSPEEKIALAGTIQFGPAVHAAKAALGAHFASVVVPQAKPLSGGEVLGCTAPSMPRGSVDVIVFVADGRFHLEAFMIANPNVKSFRYDPYSKVLSLEEYDHHGMREARRKAIEQANGTGKHWGIVLGTLGRQGNPKVLAHIEDCLSTRDIKYTVFLMSELSPTKIALFENAVDVWVQIACPRLSIDWGEAFSKPLLNPYEANVCLGLVKPWWSLEPSACKCVKATGSAEHDGSSSCKSMTEMNTYPMDYYARDGGPWNSSYMPKPRPRVS
ncbi:hypothetical protein L7F22_041515 [Adiantum nelumboides]|nr:hypothetical protein [Adiantum nelumboides]